MPKQKIGRYKKHTLMLLYTADRTGAWHYVYGLEADCRAWIAPYIEDPNYRFEILQTFRSFPYCKDAAQAALIAEQQDKARTYSVSVHFAKGMLEPAEYISNGRVLCKWRSNQGDTTQKLFVTKLGQLYQLRSREQIFAKAATERGAIELFDRYTAQPR